jgi:hypothetical protein
MPSIRLLDMGQRQAPEPPRRRRIFASSRAGSGGCATFANLISRPIGIIYTSHQTTALGAVCLAGLSAGVDPESAKFADNWRLERRFKPNVSAATRERKLKGRARAVRGTAGERRGGESVSLS